MVGLRKVETHDASQRQNKMEEMWTYKQALSFMERSAGYIHIYTELKAIQGEHNCSDKSIVKPVLKEMSSNVTYNTLFTCKL